MKYFVKLIISTGFYKSKDNKGFDVLIKLIKYFIVKAIR